MLKHRFPSPFTPKHGRNGCLILAAGVLVAAFVSVGTAQAMPANGQGPDTAYACFARSSLYSDNGLWKFVPDSAIPDNWELLGPTYYSGGGTDGHGLNVLQVGFQNGPPGGPCSGGVGGPGDTTISFCFAHQVITAFPTSGNTTYLTAFGLHLYGDRGPEFYQGSHSDGYGLYVASGGFADGVC